MLSEMGARFATMYLVISFVIILWLGGSIALYLYLKNREEREESKKERRSASMQSSFSIWIGV